MTVSKVSGCHGRSTTAFSPDRAERHLCVDIQRIFFDEGPWPTPWMNRVLPGPPLAPLCPPATIIEKTRYSAFAEPCLIEHLRQREADALIVTGSETDVCVLATVLDAVNLGYRVIVVRDMYLI
jgi:Isochorismatase family